MDGSPDRIAAAYDIIERQQPPSDVGLAESLERSGVFNFRDLAAAQSRVRPLRSGLLFRSDALSHCRTTDAQLLANLGVRRVLDLRTESERIADGVFEHPNIVTVHVPMIENLAAFANRLGIDQRPHRLTGDFMPDFYLNIAAINSGAIALCVAEIIASAVDDEAVVVHGTSGKDRTGIVASLVLAIAGVDDHDIGVDYAKSGDAVAKLTSWRLERSVGADKPTAERLTARQQAAVMGASPSTIIAFLNGIRRHYGSVEDYLAWGGTNRSELDRARSAFA